MYPQLEFSPPPKVLSPQEQKNQSKEEEVIGFGSSIFWGYAWLKTSFRTEIESRSTRHINGTRCFQRTEENDPGPGDF